MLFYRRLTFYCLLRGYTGFDCLLARTVYCLFGFFIGLIGLQPSSCLLLVEDEVECVDEIVGRRTNRISG